MKLTRRQLLGTIGLGTVGVGSITLGQGHPGFTNYAYADTGDADDRRLRVGWYERYNGRFRGSHGEPTDDGIETTLDPATAPAYVTEASDVVTATGPVVTVGDVVPGDEGTLVVGLEVVEDEDFLAQSLDVWLRATIVADAENGINGPERRAGDDTPNGGELDDDITLELWRDGSPLGTCNGRKEFDETLESPIVPRQPASVALGPSSDVAADQGHKILSSLSPGTTRCVALAWAFPDVAANRSQGDGLAFTLTFAGAPAGQRSPFVEPMEGA